MPYYFECTYCNQRQGTDLHGPELAVNCSRCGEDLCNLCAVDGLCDNDYADEIDRVIESEEE